VALFRCGHSAVDRLSKLAIAACQRIHALRIRRDARSASATLGNLPQIRLPLGACPQLIGGREVERHAFAELARLAEAKPGANADPSRRAIAGSVTASRPRSIVPAFSFHPPDAQRSFRLSAELGCVEGEPGLGDEELRLLFPAWPSGGRENFPGKANPGSAPVSTATRSDLRVCEATAKVAVASVSN
jgi:hypothetical protein